jgi:origin recognition complex subunit 1
MTPPTRRSTRGQPITVSFGEQSASDVSWCKNPTHTRTTDPGQDFTDLERHLWENTDDPSSQTIFYEQFQKRPIKTTFRHVRNGNDALKTFSVGDTVLVSSYTLSVRKIPSVAVITGMWETEFGPDTMRKHIGIHWFIRPHELPAIRAKRSSREVPYSQLLRYLLT